MKTKELTVPVEIMADFAGIIEEHDLSNEIMGVNEDGEITVRVHYEKEDRQGVFELTELIDDHYSDDESEED